jgi:hypothetical protein
LKLNPIGNPVHPVTKNEPVRFVLEKMGVIGSPLNCSCEEDVLPTVVPPEIGVNVPTVEEKV